MSEHTCFSFNTAYTPAYNTKSIDHRSVGVRSNKGIWINDSFTIDSFSGGYGSQILQIHLMHDTGSWRNCTEVIESGLCPAKETVAFLVALKLHVHIVFQSVCRTESINHNRVVNYKVNGNERVDLFRISAGFLYGVTHSCQIYDYRNTGKVLKYDTSRDKRNFFIAINVA
ncbi:hypothetical protein D3C78_1188480 [compost metagenome]